MNSFPWSAVWILTGPTGSGKSQLGLELAERLCAEIISMDSMALYRGMDIGTAKPTAAEQQRIRHHLVDVLDPWESASVAWWLEQVGRCARDIVQRGKQVLFVGGTPLYLKALLRGLFPGPPGNEELRQQLATQAATVGPEAFHQSLAVVDPVAAAKIHPHDVRRLIRAWEVFQLTGKGISSWQTQWAAEKRGFATRTVWLDLPRAELYERINRRVEAMFAAGFVEEVQALRRLERPLSREARQALGYKEVLAYLDGQGTLAETMALVQMRTRNFAKRQITWFRHLPECQPASAELTRQLWKFTMEKSREVGQDSA